MTSLNELDKPLDSTTFTAYENGIEHLHDALHLLELRIRLQLEKTNYSEQQQDPSLEPFKGLVVSQEEVLRILDAMYDLGKPILEMERFRKEIGEWEERITAKCERSRLNDIRLPLEHLRQQFGLDEHELFAVIAALAVQIDRKYEKLYAYLQDDVTCKYVSADLVMKLLDKKLDERFAMRQSYASHGKLMRHFFQMTSPDNGQMLLTRELRLDERITEFIFQPDSLGGQVGDYAKLISSYDSLDPLLWNEGLPDQIEQYIVEDSSNEDEGTPKRQIIYLWGRPGSGKKLLAKHICKRFGMPLIVADVKHLTGREKRRELDLLVREAILQRAALCLDRFGAALEEDESGKMLLEAVRVVALEFPGHLFLLADRPWRSVQKLGSRDSIVVELPIPGDDVRKQLWQMVGREFPVTDTFDWGEIAGKYRFTIGQMRDALKTAANLTRWQSTKRVDSAITGSSKTMDMQDKLTHRISMETLNVACSMNTDHQLAKKAKQITPRTAWDDLILPDEQKSMLKHACMQMKLRYKVYGEWGFGRKLSYGKGLSMLYAGPPGTGKTMSAEVVARELGYDMYRIDLSQVISKYIGETEKNLHEIFTEAQYSHAILFFDEADALFSKRSDVKDSHDKYANVETAYLLQKMEDYEGVAILATNLLQNIDEAFMRRFQFVVKFPFPDAEHREKLWRSFFPRETPIDPRIDYTQLARQFQISGGNIKNIAINASFLAAEEGQSVGMKHIVAAAKHEMQKTGKLLPKGSLNDWYES